MIARITHITLWLAAFLTLVVSATQVRTALAATHNADPEVLAALESALGEAPEKVRQRLHTELKRVCTRESHCEQVAHHEADGWSGRRFWEGAVAKGWLQPEVCDEHALGDHPEDWAPRGSWGVSPAYTLRFADDENEDGEPDCWGPEAHDDPWRAARLTVRWALALHKGGYTSCADRVRVWVGVGRWQRLSPADRLLKIVKQCGYRT